MPQTFGDGALPWNHWYEYSVTNIEVPNDYRPHVTVLYSGRNTSQDRYLAHWFKNHPALVGLRTITNFKEMSEYDPAYQSYLKQSVPSLPAILVTAPAGNGYFAKTSYLSYGKYLSADPNKIAEQLELSIAKSKEKFDQQNYQPQVQQSNLPPVIPQTEEPEPVVIEPVPEPIPDTILTADQTGLVVLGMIIAFVIASANKRR